MIRSMRWLTILVAVMTVMISEGSGQEEISSREVSFQDENDQVKVMSFNIRYGTADDGPNHWDRRRQMVIDLIARQGADVVGLQEAKDFQIDQIQGALDSYGAVTAGRNDGVLASVHCTILYRRDRFIVADSGTFWFSDTPEVPGSRGWGAWHPRNCTWVRLIERQTGRGLYVYNVHLDNRSQESRLKSTELLSTRIAERDHKQVPVVAMGDFNMRYDNDGMQHFLKEDAPVELVDTWRIVHPHKPETRTFHGFRGLTEGHRIDFILVDPDTGILGAEIDRYNEDGRYPSDHYPITAMLKPWTEAQQWELLPEPPAMLPAVTEGLIAWYPLNDGVGRVGRVARDRSGEDVAPNLMVAPQTTWAEDGSGLTFDSDQARAYSEEPPRKLIERLAESRAFSFEVWLAPDGLEQGGPARIVTISDGVRRRNITIGQGEHEQPGPDLCLRLRTTQTNANGMPHIVLPDTIIEQPAQYVVTYGENRTVTIYRDGKQIYRGEREGDLNWDTGYRLAFGDEPNGERNWRGQLYRVGIYDRELTAEEVEQNHKHWTADEEPEEDDE